jgi:hypothetical protein
MAFNAPAAGFSYTPFSCIAATRKQPALVFGLASLAGFLAFRVIKSSPPESSMEQDPMSERFEDTAKQFHGI